MVTELLTLRDLRVQTLKERKEGRLTKIPNSFFTQITNLENQIRNVIEQSKDDVKRLEKSNSDMRKLMDLKLELHKLRERKLTDLAREKVNGQNPKSENVHSNESEYLESICSVIEKHRKNTLLSTDFEFIPQDKPDLKKETIVEEKEEVKIEEKVEHIHNDMIHGNKAMIKVMIGAAGTVVAGLLSTIVVILINVQ